MSSSSKIIYFVNYQREVPPFAFNEMREALKYFDKVIYISPKLYNNNCGDLSEKNLFYKIGNKWDEFVSFLCLPFLFFSRASFKNLKAFLKSKKKCFSEFIYSHLVHLYEARTLKYLIRKAIKEHGPGILISCWFNACALATGQIAQKNKKLISFSFAHAFEIDKSRSNIIGLQYDELKFNLNKKIFFISSKMMEQYISLLEELDIDPPLIKFTVRYLGTRFFGLNPSNRFENKLHILSCSSIVDVKRLQLMPQILSQCKSNIVWTHIGDGDLKGDLMSSVNHYLNNNDHISFNFMGKKRNNEVLEFYKNNHIDLFINISSTEGLPVSIMEASSFGIPSIATNVGGTSEIISCDSGFLIEKDFEIADVSKIIDNYAFFENDIVLQYRRNCYEKWNNFFNIETNASVFYNFMYQAYCEELKYEN